MKKLLLFVLIASFTFSSCKKDKINKEEETPPVEVHKMILTTEATDKIKLAIVADAADRTDVWIDLNNNGKREAGEEISHFGNEGLSEYALNGSQTITLYGKITILNCQVNKLTKLNVAANPALTNLNCWENNLTELDLTKNIVLTQLNCSKNQLTGLDLSKNTALLRVECDDNGIAILDISSSTELIWLSCSNNQLTGLDVSKNIKLSNLSCYKNRLTALNITNNTVLTQLMCSVNQLAGLDVSKNTALKYLECDNNQLTGLDVSKNVKLQVLACSANQLTSLDISENIELENLRCHLNKIKSEKMKSLVNSLPGKSSIEAYAYIIAEQTHEANELPVNIVTLPPSKPYQAVAKNKNWQLYKYNSLWAPVSLNP